MNTGGGWKEALDNAGAGVMIVATAGRSAAFEVTTSATADETVAVAVVCGTEVVRSVWGTVTRIGVPPASISNEPPGATLDGTSTMNR